LNDKFANTYGVSEVIWSMKTDHSRVLSEEQIGLLEGWLANLERNTSHLRLHVALGPSTDLLSDYYRSTFPTRAASRCQVPFKTAFISGTGDVELSSAMSSPTRLTR